MTLAKNNEQAFKKLVDRLKSKADQDKESFKEVFLTCKYLGDSSNLLQQNCSILASIIDSELPKMIFSSRRIDPYVAHESFISKFEATIDFAQQK